MQGKEGVPTAAVRVGSAGDVYAHNIVVDASGKATLLDYGQRPSLQTLVRLSSPAHGLSAPRFTAVCRAGASFFYKPGTLPYEAQEVRAFGLFLSDLIARIDWGAHGSPTRQKLEGVSAACLEATP